VAARDHQWRQVGGANGCDGGPAVAIQCPVDAGGGRDDGGDRAAHRVVRRARSSHRPLDRVDRAEMTLRPKVSTLVVMAMALTMAVLLVAAVLLGRSAEPRGRTVVTVRLWDE